MSKAAKLGPVRPEDLGRLEPPSAAVSRLAQALGEPEGGPDEAVRAVESDPALAAGVLRWAGLAWNSSPTPPLTVRDAVAGLGAGRVLTLAVGRHLSGVLSRPLPGYRLAEKELWRHSVATALAVEHLSHFASEQIPAIAPAAGLLHDLGKLLLEPYLAPEVVREIRDLVSQGRLNYVAAELQVLGTDHAQLGAILGRRWQLPENLVLAVENHHDPDNAPNRVLDAVHIGNTVAKLVGVGLGDEGLNLRISTDSGRRLGLAAAGLEGLCARVRAELAKVESRWEVM